MPKNAKITRKTPKKVILSFDPGTDNFAWCAARGRRPIGGGYIYNTVKEFEDDATDSMREFKKEIAALLRKYQPHHIKAERFQVRGRWMGKSAEMISFMLGIITTMSPTIPKTYIISSSWKNRFNREYGMKTDKFYPIVCGTGKGRFLPHIVDAYLISQFEKVENGRKSKANPEKPIYKKSRVNRNVKRLRAMCQDEKPPKPVPKSKPKAKTKRKKSPPKK